MATIDYKELQKVVLAARAQVITNVSDPIQHDAGSLAGVEMFQHIGHAGKQGEDPIQAFVEREKLQLTNPDEKPAAIVMVRKIYDEVRAELKRLGVKIPERDESTWVTRTSEYPVQKSFDSKTGYKGRGD